MNQNFQNLKKLKKKELLNIINKLTKEELIKIIETKIGGGSNSIRTPIIFNKNKVNKESIVAMANDSLYNEIYED